MTLPPRRLAPSTIRDVAEAAQVSTAAVSRHFNRRITLPAETAARIEKAAADLGYRPNVAARRLSTGTSESLGVVISDVAYPFFAAVASAAEAECARQGYSLLIFNSRNLAENEIGFLHRISEAQVDGVLLMTNHMGQAGLAEMINRVGNVVLADEDVPGAQAPRLFARNHEGGLLVTQHLLAHGHRRIAYVGGAPELLSTRERLAGYRAALAGAGIAPDPALELFTGYDAASGAAAFAQLDALDAPPTAIFAAADIIATGLLRVMRRHGLHVPEAASLVGFDDSDLADVLDPPLTTVRQSPEAFGTRGIRMLLETIAGRLPARVTEYVDVELIARNSVGPPRRPRHWRDTALQTIPG
ncbi:LacI family DNA-binding transcriptional regulator [Xinfangfangia pollutisoli]|uniref:LacI family DNA-binding transcriptional regulator n=1 Tax=Xinfangfangia pollutisoli TaxID=2865960 RepID=UPI001CD5DBF9|nr:LacI family DNA-binding transcriptional regulator [Xinfangfangia pollutisoli]